MIMEKKYIKPEIQVVEVELQPMMAASVGDDTLGVSMEETDNNNALSKEHNGRFDIWGLDE